ncbi:MAG: Ribosomal RNA small subunit methyltransferase H [Chlamydiae bacterium]|nr:Ribosomal RNA small subunit methyltransferase H [Chlamydiota bacterium]
MSCPSSSNKPPHEPIMVEELLNSFEGKQLSVFFDGTVGGGGHARAILAAHPEITLYIGCDRDPTALELARESLAPWKEKVRLVRGNYADLEMHLNALGVEVVNGFFLI